MSAENVEINHTLFGKTSLKFPIQWDMDPHSNKNWCHHLMSLRWLKKVEQEHLKLQIIKDFHKFHIVDRRKNRYYSGLLADHTMAIRSDILLWLYKEFLTHSDLEGAAITMALLRDTVRNMLEPVAYRVGHNHGLMLDMALLRCGVEHETLLADEAKPRIFKRASTTLRSMFDPKGYTKEHSIAYQLFNAILATNFHNLAKRIGKIDEDLTTFVRQIRRTTRELIPFFLRENGTLFPIGDSGRTVPLTHYRTAISAANDDDRQKALDKIAKWPAMRDRHLSTDAGFAALKFSKPGSAKIHLFFTCSWHSMNHKQNDEFSFCLDVNGTALIDEIGFNGAQPLETIQGFKRETCHSNFSLAGHEWSDVRHCDNMSRIIECRNNREEFVVAAEHRRISDYVSTRFLRFDKAYTLTVRDEIRREDTTPFSRQCEHRFVLAPEAECRIGADEVEIAVLGKILATLSTDCTEGRWAVRRVDYVPAHGKILQQTDMLVFTRRVTQDAQAVTFAFQFPVQEAD